MSERWTASGGGARRLGVTVLALAVAIAAAAMLATGAAARSARAAATPDAGTYNGTIGAGFQITFDVTRGGRTITKMKTNYEGTVDCGPPASNPPSYTFPTITVAHGSFKGKTSKALGGGLDPHYTITGTFTTAKHVVGWMHVGFSFPGGAVPPCNETDSFAATRES